MSLCLLLAILVLLAVVFLVIEISDSGDGIYWYFLFFVVPALIAVFILVWCCVLYQRRRDEI